MTRYMWAIKGAVSGELLTFKGAALVHSNWAEVHFLLPAARVVQVDTDQFDRVGLPWMELSDHPELSWLHWPLRQVDFR